MSNYISIETPFDQKRRKNFFYYSFFSSTLWMMFHFTLVFFFTIEIQSVLMVGIFLAFGNLVSFLADSPVGVLQRYFKPKRLFLISASLMAVVSAIFLYFTFFTKTSLSNLSVTNIFTTDPEMLKTLFSAFFWSIFHIILLIISVLLYGIIKELSDVTSLSYIMNNADPSEYASIISKNNIVGWMGALVWLLSSGLFLSFRPTLAIMILLWCIALFLLFIHLYFDNAEKTLDFSPDSIKKFKFVVPVLSIELVKNFVVESVSKVELVDVVKKGKTLFLRPMSLKPELKIAEIWKQTKNDIFAFYLVLFRQPYGYRMLLYGSVFMAYGFWDTFATSFLLNFLNTTIHNNQGQILARLMGSGYVFIACIAVVAYGLQWPCIKLSRVIGVFPIILTGVFLSAISIIMFGISSSFIFILIFGVMNGFGYAAAMPLAQSGFSEEYNEQYANKNKFTEIDSTASAAPMKMIANLANVFGLFLGGILVSIFWYTGTFFVFWLLLLSIGILSFVRRSTWALTF